MPETITPEEAFIGIMASAVAADDNFVDPELQMISLISTHHPYTRTLTAPELEEMIVRVREHVLRSDPITAIDFYCEQLPPEWSGTAFLCALDLIYIDGEAHPQEEQLIEQMANKFALSNDVVSHFRSVFKEKNGIPPET